jgi:glycosyltransferase involved in cell wall biosynthesis
VTILYLADIRFPLERANGIQSMETCYALARRGHSVRLVVRPDTHAPPRDPFAYYGLPPHDRLVIERAPSTGPAIARRVSYLAYAAGRAASVRDVEVVMTRDLAVAALLLRLPSVPPLVYESHGYAPDVAAALPSLLSTAHAPPASKLARLSKREALVWARAAGYVTITQGLMAAHRKRFGDRPRTAVVPDGARVPTGAAPRDAASGRPVVVAYAGHLYPWKGVDVLVDALSQVPDVQGLIVGGHAKEPDLSRLRARAASLDLEKRITFTGLVPPADVAAHLHRADILALPNPESAISTEATSPLKLFEYMSAGRAIIASDLPSIREVLTHNVTAWLVEPGNPAALAAGLRLLADDAALRERLGRAARTAVAEYSWERRAERLEALFADVIASTR